MKKLLVILVLVSLALSPVIAQVGISTDNSNPDPSAMLDVKSSNKGFLPPRMTSGQRNGIVSPVSGLLIYNTDCNDMQFYNSAEWIPVGKTGMLVTPGLISGNATAWFNSGELAYSITPVPGATGYSWSVPPGAVITSGQGTTAITVAYGSNGGNICVAAYNDCYRSVVNCLAITFASNLPLGISISASSMSVCAETPVTYTAVPENAGSDPVFHWKVNGSNVGSNSPVYSYIPANHDEVSCDLTAGSTIITGDTAHSNVIEMEVSTPGPVSVSITAAPHPNCYISSYDFNASSTNGGDNPLYQWSLNGENVPGATNLTFNTATLGRLECQVTSNSTCITGNPAATNFLETGECQNVDMGDPIILYCTLQGCDHPGATFTWVNSTGTWMSNAREPIIYPGSNGYATDTFYLTVNYSPPQGSYNQGVYFISLIP